jgi:hypothetical protein
MRFVDLTGRKFGRWNVRKSATKENGRTRWHCDCDCGTPAIVYGNTLIRGTSTSCGCARLEKLTDNLVGKEFADRIVVARAKTPKGQRGSFWRCNCKKCRKMSTVDGGDLKRNIACQCSRGIDETGKRYGLLRVLWLSRRKKGDKDWYWRCECDCGRKVTVSGNHLRSGHTRSCGYCLAKRERNQFGQFMAAAGDDGATFSHPIIANQIVKPETTTETEPSVKPETTDAAPVPKLTTPSLIPSPVIPSTPAETIPTDGGDGASGHKHYAQAKHEKWKSLKETMSYQEIVIRHKDDTGETVTVSAVKMALKRLK